MEDEQLGNKDLIIYLTINNTSFEEVEVSVKNPDNSTRSQINSMIQVFELPKTDNRGHKLLYLLGLIKDNQAIPKILEFETKDGKEISFNEHNLQPGDHLLLFSIPSLNPHPSSILHSEESNFDSIDFIVKITIDGTSFEEVEVKVNDPNKTIRDQINGIVQVFELPKMDNGGNPIQYLMGQETENGDEPKILEFEDSNGREQSLLDYHIQPGDHLRLLAIPCAYGCPIPNDFQQETNKKSHSQKLKHFFRKLFHLQTK